MRPNNFYLLPGGGEAGGGGGASLGAVIFLFDFTRIDPVSMGFCRVRNLRNGVLCFGVEVTGVDPAIGGFDGGLSGDTDEIEGIRRCRRRDTSLFSCADVRDDLRAMDTSFSLEEKLLDI